jgi:hypothetical protein
VPARARTPSRRPDPRCVVTPLDADAIEAQLRELKIEGRWAHVVHGIRHGFEVGAGAAIPATITHENHKSAELDPDFIDSYIASEHAAGRYSAPFTRDELEHAIGPFRTSPLGLVPKAGSSKRWRLIQDLSYPKKPGAGPASVNAGIDSDDFPTEWGTFDDTSAMLLSLPDGCQAATFDVTAAYRITPVAPAEQNALCILWQLKYYIDFALAFGLASSAGVFGSIADMLVHIYILLGFGLMLKWVDDFFVIRLPGQTWSEEDFLAVGDRLGVPWSREKLRRFASVQRYIGFDWNLDARSVSFPADKREATLALVAEWAEPTARWSGADAARLHGKLVHMATCYPLIRPFVVSAGIFAARFTSPRARLHVSSGLAADLAWITELVPVLPPELPLARPEPIDVGWWGDASTSFGVGVVVGGFWGVWKYAPGVAVGPGQAFDIGWAEAVAVEVGLGIASAEGVLAGSAPEHARFLVRSDNTGVAAVVNKGRSRSANTNAVLKRVYRALAAEGVSLHAEYVASRDNIADALSRGDIPGFLAGFPAAVRRAEFTLPPTLSPYLVPVT